MYLIRHLEARSALTIVTNGLKTAQELARLSHKVYCTGGLMLHNSSAYVGAYAADFVRHFNADLFFFSSRGVSEEGLITAPPLRKPICARLCLSKAGSGFFCVTAASWGRSTAIICAPPPRRMTISWTESFGFFRQTKGQILRIFAKSALFSGAAAGPYLF